ncbi:Nn.00g018650.m01.CDS01 [Neocucurbitaria sp. VM-36]
MAVAATSRPVPHGPRSPTLSDAGMILPHDTAFDRSDSPLPYIERPPSPPVLYSHSSQVKISSAPQSRRRTSQSTKSTPLSAKSSRSTLRAMGDSGTVAKGANARDDALASSPTIHNDLSSQPPSNWSGHDKRRLSTASSSVLSEDFENWPGFDSHEMFDDSGVDLEEQDKHKHFPEDSDIGDEMENERWPNDRNSGSDEDDGPYSSAALSRRAEIILANAKKRLNVMEGNLRGARESLVISPTLSLTNNSSDLSQHITAARERDRRLYAGMGPIPPRIYSYRSSPLSPNSSPGHSRGLSETSVPIPFTPSYVTRHAASKRASSAIGHTTGPWAAEGYGQGRFPIKESRSVEVLRDPRNTWGSAERESAVRSNSRSSRSPPALETLPEDEDGARIHRSTSAASGLRDQMNDLKGRISSLKLKAQEDHLRRRSLQSLRTPSPFTSAETWYSGTKAYQSGGSPIAANAGLGITTESPTWKAMYEDEYNQPSTPRTTVSQREGEKLVTYDAGEHGSMPNDHSYPVQYDGSIVKQEDEPEAFGNEADADETDEGDFVSVDGDDLEPGADSVYEDAVYELPATERHEDRVDAFDYENFFLHSAMGTYSLEGRRSSTSSGSSTATTRPVTAVQASEELSKTERRISYHQRTSSADSVSTIATFATAAEQQSDEEEEDENEQMDQFSQQILSSQYPITSRPGTQNGLASLRSDSAINMRRGIGSSPTQTSISRGSSSPADLASGLQTSKIFSILTEASRDEPRLALSEEETQLIYGLAASFQQVCANLQNTYGEAYERKTWRRRLDEARRVLNGEELDDDQSF